MNGLDPEQIKELEEVYHMLCRSDGLLGRREVSQMLSGIGVKATAQELKDIVDDVTGDDPKIDFNAFVVLMSRRYAQLSLDDELDELLKSLDADKDSKVDAADIVQLMSERGTFITVGEAQALLSTISDSPSGLTREELKTFLQTKM